jgi:YidC/Oxa1 family membrane protein insertase
MFPLVIKSQKNVINMANNMPTVQRLQEKMTEAKQRGDMLGGNIIV